MKTYEEIANKFNISPEMSINSSAEIRGLFPDLPRFKSRENYFKSKILLILDYYLTFCRTHHVFHYPMGFNHSEYSFYFHLWEAVSEVEPSLCDEKVEFKYEKI